MFAATIEPETLENAFAPVYSLVDECKLKIGEDGIDVRAVDEANVGMVELSLSSEAFESYEADSHTVGFPLVRFADIVSLFRKNGDIAHLYLDEETRTLRMEAGGLDYTLSLVDPDSIRKEPEIPNLNLTASITLTGKAFNRSVNAADMVSEHLQFGSTSNGVFYVEAEGDTDDVFVEFNVDGDHVSELEPGDAESLFSIEYLRDMGKPIPDEKETTVEIGSEFPVLITYNIADSAVNIQYVLAPRITSD